MKAEAYSLVPRRYSSNMLHGGRWTVFAEGCPGPQERATLGNEQGIPTCNTEHAMSRFARLSCFFQGLLPLRVDGDGAEALGRWTGHRHMAAECVKTKQNLAKQRESEDRTTARRRGGSSVDGSCCAIATCNALASVLIL